LEEFSILRIPHGISDSERGIHTRRRDNLIFRNFENPRPLHKGLRFAAVTADGVTQPIPLVEIKQLEQDMDVLILKQRIGIVGVHFHPFGDAP
jgi:hypothetical protein